MSLEDLSVDGRFCVLAIDHRDSLRAFLSPDDPDAISASQLTALKAELCRAVSPEATGVMLEPEYSIPQLVDDGSLADGVGFVAALESQGYLGALGESPTTVLDGWSAAAAAASGASAAKLLLPYHPERELADAQHGVAEHVLASCRDAGIPLVLEPLFYDLEGPEERPEVVLETTRRFASLGPDVLKLPFPVDATHDPDVEHWRDACESMSALCPMPWVLLSGGGTFESFHDQLRVAVGAGASGCMVGRALWGEAARASDEQRAEIITSVVLPRFRSLRATVFAAA